MVLDALGYSVVDQQIRIDQAGADRERPVVAGLIVVRRRPVEPQLDAVAQFLRAGGGKVHGGAETGGGIAPKRSSARELCQDLLQCLAQCGDRAEPLGRLFPEAVLYNVVDSFGQLCMARRD